MVEFDFNGSFGFVMHETARMLSKRFDQRARELGLGLTRAQCQVLAYLVYREGINQAGLADLLEIEPISLARLIDRMEQAGWVERRADPHDRRARRLFVTEKAKPVFARMVEVGTDTRAEALAGLTVSEREQLMELLLRVRRNLSERETAPAPQAAGAET